MRAELKTLVIGLAASAIVTLCPTAARAQTPQELQWEEAPADDAAGTDGQAANVAPSDETATDGTTQAPEYNDRDPSALKDFNGELAPYGNWRNDPTYGTVWVPDQHVVGTDFAPYVTSGHWAMADDGSWLWVSDYSFGWVVFHYGRWVWINNVGWAWIPGRRYANAWVVWRVGDPGYAYVGWAPMPPDYYWVDGVAVGIWFGVYTSWVFCPSVYVYDAHVHHYVIHDHAHVHGVAAHSHRYSAGGGAKAFRGPPPKTAHIPAKAVPKKHTPANPKAIAASRDSRPASAKVARGGQGSHPAATRSVRPAPPGTRQALRSSRTLPGTSSEPLRSARPSSSASLIPRAPGPTRGATRAPYPSRTYAPPSRTYTAPQSGTPSRTYSAPSRTYTPQPSRSSPQPSRSAPSRSSSGSRSYHPAPSPARAAPPPPPPRPSAPPTRSRGGGGGGRRR